MSWFGLIDDAMDIAGKVVEDKDKLNEINGKLSELREQVRIAELNTKTIPWVDALHKMGRQIIAVLNIAIPGIVLAIHPDIPIEKLTIIAGGGTILGGLYTALKGKGK